MKFLPLIIFAITFLELSSGSEEVPQLFIDLKNPLLDILSKKHLMPKKPENLRNNRAVTTHTIRQRINHFNAQDLRTFTQTYLFNDEFFTTDGPIILFPFFTSPFSDGFGEVYISLGPVHDLARQLNGTLVHPQHRFYENSPVASNLTMESMKSLTIAHALEDLANLIVHLKAAPGYRNSGVIVVGWGYGASIATWFAQKYPHLVDGTWSSGDALLASLTDNSPVNIVDSAVRQFGGSGCTSIVQNGFRQLENMIMNDQLGEIRRTFRLCFPLPYRSGVRDLWYFFALLGQYFHQYAVAFDEGMMRNSACGNIVNAPVQHDYQRLAYALGFYSIPRPLCYPINFAEQMDILKTEALNISSEFAPTRAVMYQECTEYGIWYSSGDGTTMFGGMFPIDFYVAICSELFGFTRQQIQANYDRFNTIYGGRKPETRNAYFTNGQLNPYRDLAVNGRQIHPTSYHEVHPWRGLHTELSIFFNDISFIAIRRRVHDAIRGWLNL